MSALKIKKWDLKDQPREKLICYGAPHLSDAELIAILLGSGTSRESALDVARNIVAHARYNSLNTWHLADFKAFRGIGKARAVTLLAALEWSRRRMLPKPIKPVITTSIGANNYLKEVLYNPVQEEAWMLCLDRANALITSKFISKGGVSSTLMDVRLVCRYALENTASAVIIAHNHPSGQLKPSTSDLAVTKKIKTALEYLDIQLLDHIILTDNSYLSFADEGLL